MSSPGHPPDHDALEGDGVDIKKIITVGVVSLVIFAISAVVAYVILHSQNKEDDARGRPPVPAMIGKDEIGIVDQLEFSQDRRLEDWRAAKRKRLNSYGWVDRQKSLVHIPIDKAIEQVLSQTASSPPGAP
jgi:hypothetical protein